MFPHSTASSRRFIKITKNAQNRARALLRYGHLGYRFCGRRRFYGRRCSRNFNRRRFYGRRFCGYRRCNGCFCGRRRFNGGRCNRCLCDRRRFNGGRCSGNFCGRRRFNSRRCSGNFCGFRLYATKIEPTPLLIALRRHRRVERQIRQQQTQKHKTNGTTRRNTAKYWRSTTGAKYRIATATKCRSQTACLAGLQKHRHDQKYTDDRKQNVN